MLAALGFLCLICCVNSIPLQQGENGTVTVRTEDGLLRGKIATSIWNRTYQSFQAIPYAQPPVGDLRFKSPRPVKPWTGVRDALEQGTYCPQDAASNTSAKMSEDCLYLNVYVPQTEASSQPSKSLTVLVWIHGGGFISGSGLKENYGPDNLMNLTAILVTINYRLGALGFMSMEHPDVTSNAGMKDQVAALRWVKRNIAHFGGNPDDVTVFGESAGGISVDLLLLSPIAEGLFHRAISESGSAMTIDFKTDYNGTQVAFRLGQALGHNATDADDLVKFLRSVADEDIVKSQDSATAGEGLLSTLNLNINPTVDAKIQEGSEVFLPDIPEKLFRAGKAHPIPYITGVNSEEMKLMISGITQATLDSYNSNMEQLIPASLNMKEGSAESLEIAAKMRSFYFGNKTINFDALPQLINLLSDIFMVYPVHRGAMLHLNYGSSPIYMYEFTYDGSLTLAGTAVNTTIKGPGHMAELPYLFYVSNQSYDPTSDDVKVIRHFTGMWVVFARSGDPSLHESVKWTPVTKTNHTYLQIDVNLSLHEDMMKERMAFWDEVYDTYKK